jgi:serine phosphatase RsbU (regulator of sigma subunit)/HAMP domain-containing protein
MTLTLRKKLIFGFLGLDIALSFLLGIFMYQFAYGMFLENFKNHKVSTVKFLSAIISGEEHSKVKSNGLEEIPIVENYIVILEKVYASDKSLDSIYTINYDSTVDKYYYALFRNKLETQWLANAGKEFTSNSISNERIIEIMRHKSEAEAISSESLINLGEILLLYSTILNSKGDTVGLVIVEANTLEVRNFRSRMIIVAFTLSVFTFFVTSVAAFILAKHFTKPLEILSAAVNNLASGNLMMIENFDKKDEFGNLAKSFNVMVNNLKIASEVQYNLIIEISNFNESLERKVEERTHTIQEQSQELEKQIMIAKKIQLSLLPEDVPKIKGASLSFRYQPMMGVGGDFIDFDYKNENDLLLFICDVSGHGVPAAFLATMVKMSLQDCYELKLGPAESLKRIHKALQGKLSGHFLSAIYCHINLTDGIMTSANAGHLPILKVGLTGEYEFINSKGRIICEAFKPNSEEVRTELKVGDKIILYTDGITEARNLNHEMFTDKRLTDISLLYHFDSSFDLCNKIYDSVLNFTGNSQSQFTDDITILVAEYSGIENEISV